jgi:uridine monophosphate synthetase
MTRLSLKERETLAKHPLAKKCFQLMQAKQSNLCLSADVHTCDELLQLAATLGPHLCMLKTHVDILSDFTPAFTHALRALADKHQFLIFEDRKFADIGNTVKNQYEGGVYRIADWAHLVNAHSLPGNGIIDGLASVGLPKQNGLLLLAEMSSHGHLMTPDYQQATIAMAKANPDFVLGFITQHAHTDNPAWLNLTPGVQLAENKDTLGQRYITPEKAIIENGNDIMIVGRGILQAKNPLATTKAYQTAGWTALLKKQA